MKKRGEIGYADRIVVTGGDYMAVMEIYYVADFTGGVSNTFTKRL